MTISEIKKWAKQKGYSITKKMGNEEEGIPVSYEWYKIDDPSINGTATSVSKVATAVFNHLTDNKWLQYQIDFKNNEKTQFTIEDYS